MLLNISFHFDYYPLLVITAIAWATPILLSVLKLKKIPSVVVEIIMGYFIGKYLLSSIDHESYRILGFFALTGFVFLMFLGGLEIDVDQILASIPRRKLTYKRFFLNPLPVSIVYFILTIILANIGAWLLSNLIAIPNIWYFSLIIVTTSIGVVLPVLKDRGETKNRFGQMIIISAAVADIFSIILLTLTATIIKNGFQNELIYIIGLFILFTVFYFVRKWLMNIPLIRRLTYQLSHAASQIQVRGSILMMILFVVMAQLIGEEAILLGAFLIGLVLSSQLHRERSVMLLKLDSMGYGFFIPFFFIMVGVEFDPAALKEFDQSLGWFLVLLLITLYAVKIIPALLWRKLFGMKKTLAGGFLMSSRLSLIIAASAIGVEMGVITPGMNACFIIMAIITCFLSPVIFNLLSPADLLTGEKTIIIGGSSTGVLLSRRLSMHGKKSVIIDNNSDRVKQIASKGINCMEGDGCDLKLFEKINLRSSDFVIVDTGSPEKNLSICKNLKMMLSHDNVITRSSKAEIELSLNSLGVNTIDVIRVLATTIENLIIRPATYHTLLESFENFSVEEILITNREIDGVKLKEIPFHKDAILIMVKRNNAYFIPHGEIYFHTGDILHVFGTDSALHETRDKLKRNK